MLANGLSLTARLRGGGIGYAALNYQPGLVLDFGRNYFQTTTAKPFDSVLTSATTGLCTMHDSAGNLVWNPHNLALNSATPATQSITVVSGASYTVNMTGSGSVALSGAGTGTVTDGSPATITASTTTLTLTVSGSPSTMWAHRSDLGGMAVNPDTGTTYVPTTSAAKYLPRRNAHEYIGGEWVKGLRHESAAATNLEPSSLTKMLVGSGGSSAKNYDGPLGTGNMWTVTYAGAGANYCYTSNISFTSGTTYCLSFFFKRGTGTKAVTTLLYGAHFNSGGANIVITYDLSAKTASVSGGAVVSKGVQDLGGGWFRLYAAATATASAITEQQFYRTGGGDAGNYDYIGGCQVEAGSVPSSYIPTYGATATRAAETLVIPSANLPTYQAVTGMRALKSSTWAAGYVNDGIKGAWLSSTDTTSLVGAELVTNGGFDTDTSGWTPTNATLASVSGEMEATAVANGQIISQTDITTEVGKTYQVSVYLAFDNTTGNVFFAAKDSSSTTLTSINMGSTVGTYTFTFTATTTTSKMILSTSSGTLAGEKFRVDNVSVKLTDADRSVNANPLTVNGTITRAPVATGSSVAAYSGFSSSNYLQQPYNSDLDFGTGDFCVDFWLYLPTIPSATDWIFSRNGTGFAAWVNASNLGFNYNGVNACTSALPSAAEWTKVSFVKSGSTLSKYYNGVLADTAAGLSSSLGATTSPLLVGNLTTDLTRGLAGSLALLRISNVAPTATQIAAMYAAEAPLFEAGAGLSAMAGDAVSIQMDGLMTYADLNSAGTPVLARWYKDANNYILTDIDTDGAATGEVNFNQAAAGTLDTVASGASALSPGVNVAFNIASRHETNSTNGAVNGTVLTADTTPTSLPDLTAANLSIGHTFNGLITKFGAWGNGIGDTGLAAATT